MGTSVVEIDRTYGHLVSDSEERNRDALDAYDVARAKRQEAASRNYRLAMKTRFVS
jgi:hypothetical protein